MNVIEMQRALRQLRLSGIADGLEARLLQAQTEKLMPIDFLSVLVNDELVRRQDRLLERRIKQAAFRDGGKTLAERARMAPGALTDEARRSSRRTWRKTSSRSSAEPSPGRIVRRRCGEHTSRRAMGRGSAPSAFQPSRIGCFNAPSRWCWKQCTRRSFSSFRMASGLVALRIKHVKRSGLR
jgi:hypothetical protein